MADNTGANNVGYRRLRAVALALALFTAAWMAYDMMADRGEPAAQEFQAANRLFQDRAYARSVEGYEAGLKLAPDSVYGLRGIARALMQLNRGEEALAAFDHAIEIEPNFAGTYANRGILLDRMERYDAAMADYAHALALDAELVEGPGWLTRFMRNQSDTPPTIVDRLTYLRQEMAKPKDQRLLRVPDQDESQRPYKR